MGTSVAKPLHFSCAAEAYTGLGRHAEAVKAMDQAFGALRESKDDILAADLHRVCARITIAARADGLDEAEAHFQQALGIALAQGALALELRAAMDLAKLLAGRREKHQAADLLRPIYSSFTGGFKTPDLLDAHALLEDLL